jgi:hypothetical protein
MSEPRHTFATQSEWEAWLEGHGGTSPGVWLRLAKKSAEQPTVTYAQALETALCHGWIDGQKQSEDQHYWLQRFTPRTARSIWSKINKEKAEALIAAERMRPAGLAAVKRGQAERAMGCRLRISEHFNSPRRPATGARCKPQRQGVLCNAQQSEPVCHPVSNSERQEGRDPCEEDRSIH